MCGKSLVKRVISVSLVLSLAILLVFEHRPVYAADERARMTIGTGNSGGVFYVLGAAMANVITQKSKLVELTAQATTATTENLNFVNTHNLDFGFTLFDVAHCAYTGTREYESIGKLENLRVVVLGHVGLNTFAVFQKSPIKNIGNIKPGKDVIACGSGYTGFLLSQTGLYGWGLDLPTNSPVLSYTEQVTALKD
ncbi:MAG: TAXI family TRAP transporter solute-binding subunit, partial [Synergistaceae bacterium]|nr:TAXI family TRAP transporter solute-binding subunit [Synergistaceae bacterium]